MKKLSIVLAVVIIGLVGVLFYTNGGASFVERDDRPTVITSFYPLYYFTSEIVGDTMQVVNIGRNNDPHDFTPSARDIVRMQEAALVVLQGSGLEAWGEDVEHQLEDAGVPVFVATEHLALRELKKDGHGDGDAHGHEEEAHGHGHEEAHKDEHDHDHGSHDPHTWLDPVLAAETVEHLAEELIAIDPANAELYSQNANVLIQELTGLDDAYRTALSAASCTAEEALVSHDAFGYMAERYGLIMHPIAGISTKDEPSAKLLAELKEEAEDGVLAVLTEENSVKEYAETIAQETGIMLVPISALAAGPIVSEDDYLDGMRANLESLKQGYGCAE